jgi:hypothetical protein
MGFIVLHVGSQKHAISKEAIRHFFFFNLLKNEIGVGKCRGRVYYHAVTMSRQYSGYTIKDIGYSIMDMN